MGREGGTLLPHFLDTYSPSASILILNSLNNNLRLQQIPGGDGPTTSTTECPRNVIEYRRRPR
jgi:hypothetical protein